MASLASEAQLETYEEVILSTVKGDPNTPIFPKFAEHVTNSEDGKAENETLALALRRVAGKVAAQAIAADERILKFRGDSAVAIIPRLLELVEGLVQRKEDPRIDPKACLDYTILEDLGEMSTIQECEHIFEFLAERLEGQRNREESVRTGQYDATKLNPLRICNSMLRRLSKANHAVFAGRIWLFLAKHYSLDDRSGVNVQGHLNTSHSTPVEEVPEGALDTRGQPINREFFKTFWSLQAVFQRPFSELTNDPNLWTKFVNDIKAVLTEFAATEVSAGGSAGALGSSGLTVKYLSSSQLIGLQLQDASFRRHFLLQTLIFLHSCRHRRKTKTPEEIKAEEVKSGTKPVRTASGLKVAQDTSITDLEALLYKQLDGTPEQGVKFRQAVQRILARETHWLNWKADKALAIARAPQPLPGPSALEFGKKKSTPALSGSYGPVVEDDQTREHLRMGSSDLDQLWMEALNNEETMEYCPEMCMSWEARVDTIKGAMEMLDEEEEKPRKERATMRPLFTWQTLRQVVGRDAKLYSRVWEDLEEIVHDAFPNKLPKRYVEPKAAPKGDETEGASEPQDDSAAASPAATGDADENPSAAGSEDDDAAADESAPPQKRVKRKPGVGNGAAANGTAANGVGKRSAAAAAPAEEGEMEDGESPAELPAAAAGTGKSAAGAGRKAAAAKPPGKATAPAGVEEPGLEDDGKMEVAVKTEPPERSTPRRAAAVKGALKAAGPEAVDAATSAPASKAKAEPATTGRGRGKTVTFADAPVDAGVVVADVDTAKPSDADVAEPDEKPVAGRAAAGRRESTRKPVSGAAAKRAREPAAEVEAEAAPTPRRAGRTSGSGRASAAAAPAPRSTRSTRASTGKKPKIAADPDEDGEAMEEGQCS